MDSQPPDITRPPVKSSANSLQHTTVSRVLLVSSPDFTKMAQSAGNFGSREPSPAFRTLERDQRQLHAASMMTLAAPRGVGSRHAPL